MKLFIVLSIIISITTAAKSKTDVEVRQENKSTSAYLFKYDLIILLVILVIKFKAVIIILAFIFGFGAYSKFFTGVGGYYKSLKCPPQVVYESPHKNHHDWDGHSDRRDLRIDYSMYTENMDLELLSSVMKGIGIMNMNFNATDTRQCKKWMICEAERNAYTKPVLAYTVHLLSNTGTLSRYRNSRSATERTECTALIPECRASTKASTQNSYHRSQRRRPPKKRFLADGT